jgi:hypothetical protein
MFNFDWKGEGFKKDVAEICKKSVKETAEKVAAKSRDIVPVDKGGLKSSIKVTEYSKGTFHRANVEAGEPGREHIAFFVEVKTRSFLRAPLKQEQNDFLDILKAQYERIV